MKRKVNYISCKICNKEFALVGFQSHLSNTHNISINDYVIKYGEYRPKQLYYQNQQGGEYKCLIDSKTFKTNKGLMGYIKSQYKISAKEYILKYMFSGITPKCMCGCNNDVKILSFPPYKLRYVSGHNDNPMNGKSHSIESKKLMSIQALKRVNNFKRLGLPLPIHTPDVLIKRGKIYSDLMMGRKCKRYKVNILNNYESQQNGEYTVECNVCKNQFTQFHNSYFICKKCNPPVRSKMENEFVEFFYNIDPNINLIRNYRKFKGMEIDILFPDKNIGVEFNGLFWHSENGGNKHRDYHVSKTDLCAKNGIRLIQVFSDDWVNLRLHVQNKLKHILGYSKNLPKIFARSCNIKPIDFSVKKDFLIKNHIQGNDASQISLGCFNGDKLVSVMTFSRPNISKGFRNVSEGTYELQRFCSDYNLLCIGTFSKLLKHFIREYNPKLIITFADLCWSSEKNNVYEKSGFKLIKRTEPSYWYTDKYDQRIHRFNFTKKKLVSKGHDPSKTEWEIMKSLGYDRIWDCGNLKYELNFN